MSNGVRRASLTTVHKGTVSLRPSLYSSRHHVEDSDSRKSRVTRRNATALTTLTGKLGETARKSSLTEPTSISTESQQVLVETCAACGQSINDRYILRALEQSWHSGCLVCSVCHGVLDDMGSSLFVKGDLVLCRHDYIRLFGSGGQCSGCFGEIASHECVIRARDLVFHPECFRCFRCGRRLCTGDRFYLENSRPICESSIIDPSLCAASQNMQCLLNEKTTRGSFDLPQTIASDCRMPTPMFTSSAPKRESLLASSLQAYRLYTPVQPPAQPEDASTISYQQDLQLQIDEIIPEPSFSVISVHCEEPTRTGRQTQVH